MTLDELRAEARRKADDTAPTPLYSDAFLAQAASEAEREACVRGRLIYDTESEFLTLSVDPDDLASLQLDPLIDAIDTAYFTPAGSARARQLDLVGTDWIADRDCSGTMTGQPRVLARVGAQGLKLWPRPTVAGVLVLTAYRQPLNAMEEGDDEPEIEAKHHDGLIDWMLYQAYSTKDGEAGDDARAKDHEARFERRFGRRPDADTQRRHRERRRITTRCGGIP